jgi:hypothetical protein
MSVLAFRHKDTGANIPWDRIVDIAVSILVGVIPDDEWDAIVRAQGEVIKLLIAKLAEGDPEARLSIARMASVPANSIPEEVQDLDWLFDIFGRLLKMVLPAKYHGYVDLVVSLLKQWF